MIRKLWKIKIIIFYIIMSVFSIAQTVSVTDTEMESQRRDFESRLQQKLEQSIGNVASKEAFIVNVSVKLRPIPPEAIPTQVNLNEEAVGFDQQVNDLEKENYVPLAKLGFWKKHSLNQPAQQRIIKRTREFLNFVSSVKVDVLLDQQEIKEEQKVAIESIVNLIVKQASPVTPQVTFQMLRLVFKDKGPSTEEVLEKYKKEQEEIKRQEALSKEMTNKDWILELKMPIALAFLTLMFFILGYIFQRNHLKFQDRKLRMEEENARRQEESLRQTVIEKDTNGESSQVGGIVVSGSSDSLNSESVSFEEEKLNSGFKLLLNFVEKDTGKAIYLIKNWIHNGSKESQYALATIPRLLTVEKMAQIVSYFTDEDRKKWNRFMNLSTDEKSYYVADKFVARQIAALLLVPAPPMEEEVKNELSAMTAKEAAQIAILDKDLGGLLLNLLDSQQVSGMVSRLDASTLSAIVQRGNQLDSRTLSANSSKVISALEKVRTQSKVRTNLFLEKVPELIQEVNLEKEILLFDSLAKSGNISELASLVKKFIPSELVKELPLEVLKLVLEKESLATRAEIIYTQQDALKEKLILALGDSERLREVLNTELEEIENSPQRRRILMKTAPKIWKDFVQKLRLLISSDDSVYDEIIPILDKWITSKTGQSAKSELENAA